VLRDSGIETYESCQGGQGHSYSEFKLTHYLGFGGVDS